MNRFAGVQFSNLKVSGIRANLHLLAPSDLTAVTDMHMSEDLRIRERCKDSATDGGRHVNDAL
jgi:hypothetical protein